MAQLEAQEAIVLRTVDIGEADRFCILLTKGKGRLAALAKGARRPQSHLQSALLPFSHSEVHLREWKGNFFIASARTLSPASMEGTMEAFCSLSQAVELLLTLLQDGEPLPHIFELTKELIVQGGKAVMLPAFTFRIIELLGLLPGDEAMELRTLTTEERAFLHTIRRGKTLRDFPSMDTPTRELLKLRDTLLAEHLPRPLRAETITPTLLSLLASP